MKPHRTEKFYYYWISFDDIEQKFGVKGHLKEVHAVNTNTIDGEEILIVTEVENENKRN